MGRHRGALLASPAPARAIMFAFLACRMFPCLCAALGNAHRPIIWSACSGGAARRVGPRRWSGRASPARYDAAEVETKNSWKDSHPELGQSAVHSWPRRVQWRAGNACHRMPVRVASACHKMSGVNDLRATMRRRAPARAGLLARVQCLCRSVMLRASMGGWLQRGHRRCLACPYARTLARRGLRLRSAQWPMTR
jgi:hypothetical protein